MDLCFVPLLHLASSLGSQGHTQLSTACSKTTIRLGKLDLLFRISHLHDFQVGGQLLFTTANSWQTYGAIKSGHVIAYKAIMTVEAAGLRRSGCWCEQYNLVWCPIVRKEDRTPATKTYRNSVATYIWTLTAVSSRIPQAQKIMCLFWCKMFLKNKYYI